MGKCKLKLKTKSKITIRNVKLDKGCRKYQTHDNYSRPFLVCIKGKIIKIYKHMKVNH